jgi:hypothetical protein
MISIVTKIMRRSVAKKILKEREQAPLTSTKRSKSTAKLAKTSVILPPEKNLLYTVDGQTQSLNSLQLIIYYLTQVRPDAHIGQDETDQVVRSLINIFQYGVKYDNQPKFELIIRTLNKLTDDEYQMAVNAMKADSEQINLLRDELLTPTKLVLLTAEENRARHQAEEASKNEQSDEVDLLVEIKEPNQAEQLSDDDVDLLAETDDRVEDQPNRADQLSDDDVDLLTEIEEPKLAQVSRSKYPADPIVIDSVLEPSLPLAKQTSQELDRYELKSAMQSANLP